jgi:hypothetical protein
MLKPVVVPPAGASPAVYLLLGRAVPTIDGWIAEMRSRADVLALIEALSIHLENRHGEESERRTRTVVE